MQCSHVITGAQPKAGTGHKMQSISVVFSGGRGQLACAAMGLRGVVPKSYRSEGQPRSTRNEFPCRGVVGNRRLFQYGGL